MSYESALVKVLERVPFPEVQTVALADSLGMVLACEVEASVDLPPYDRASMDGYALSTRDVSRVPAILDVVATVAAGAGKPFPGLGPGQAVRVMTGAVVPPGADAVQIVEKTRSLGSRVEILESVSSGQNIARKGSEARQGTLALEPGRRIRPTEVAVLAAFGVTRVQVYKRPSIAVLSTGDELVDPGSVPTLGQIRDSNASMLAAQCQALGLAVEVLPIVPDEEDRIRKALRRGLENDLVVLSGGVSMGEFDLVPKVLADEDLEVIFHKAAVRPGKPLMLACSAEKLVFGLPGNPVSAFVTFEVFVKPACRKWMGERSFQPQCLPARLVEDIRKKGNRLFFMPALLSVGESGMEVKQVLTRGSADIAGFSRCNSLMVIPAEVEFLARGSEVEVLPLDWT